MKGGVEFAKSDRGTRIPNIFEHTSFVLQDCARGSPTVLSIGFWKQRVSLQPQPEQTF